MKCIKYLISILLIVIAAIAINAYAKKRDDPVKKGIKADKIIVEKSKRRLHLMSKGKQIKKYKISLGRTPKGHKEKQGDGKTPEGTYIIDYRNSKSICHLSLHISYPDAEDKLNAKRLGVSPGGDITIHGLAGKWRWLGRLHRFSDWTEGCIAVTNKEIEEIWKLVPNGATIEIKP